MLTVQRINNKEIYTVYEIRPYRHSHTCPLFLVYNKNDKIFCWVDANNFKPQCKELFEITKKDDKKIINKVYAVHQETSFNPTKYLIYENKMWNLVYAHNYEIISTNEIN